MQRLFVVLAILIALVGCASTPPNPLEQVSNLSQKNLADISQIVFNKKRVASSDESDKLRHTKLDYGFFTQDVEGAKVRLSTKLGLYENYCAALNGTFKAPTSLSVPIKNYVAIEVACTQKNTNATIFRVIAGFEAVPAIFGHESKRGVCVWVDPQNPPRYDGFVFNEKVHRYDCNTWVDAFQWKSPGSPGDVDAAYKIGDVGFDTLQAIKENQLQQLQEQREAEAKLAQIKKDIEQRQLEQVARERERAIRDLPQVKTVGQKICRTVGITQRKIKGEFRGEPIYGESINVQAKITAFTENVSGNKIQLRISGMRVGDENVDRIDGEVVFQNGGVIWDNATNWGLCY